MAKSKKSKIIPRKKKVSKPIKKDPIAEYRASVADSGISQVLSLSDDACGSHVLGRFSFGAITLDALVGGGAPWGRVTEIYGPMHVGKSTILDHVIVSAQRDGGVGVLIDTETARDRSYTENIGVSLKDLQIVEYKNGSMTAENVLTTIIDTVGWWRDKYPDTPVVIGWDALGGTATQDELVDKSLSDAEKVAGMAKVLRRACRRIPSVLGGSKIALIIINHEYAKIGGYGGKETVGGSAVRLLASLRLRMYPTGKKIKRSDGVILGSEVGVRVEKSRFGNTWRETRIALMNGAGINNAWSLFTGLAAAGLILTSGSWSSMIVDEETYKFQGWSGFQKIFEDAPDLFQKLVSVYQNLNRE